MRKKSISPLFDAVQTADLSTMKELLEKDLDVNATNNFDETPLFFAKTRDVADLLLQHGADLEHKNQMGWTVLANAAYYHNMELVEFYLQRGADPNSQNERGSTPMQAAVMRNFFDMVELFLKYGAETRGIENAPLLACATSREMFELLVRNGADPKARDDIGNTLLVLCPNITAAGLLLEAGVGVDEANDQQETPLMLAAFSGPSEFMRFLVDHGANPNARNDRGQNVLWYVSTEDSLAFLLERGADPNAFDNRGRTPLMHCDEHLFPALVEYGANLEARDNSGATALIQATYSGRILDLLEYGARADVQDNAGTPALMACFKAMLDEGEEEEVAMKEVLSAFLKAGARPDSTDADGRTLLMLLVEDRQPALAAMLLDSGADPLLQDNNGESAFSRGCRLRDKNMLRIMALHSPAITEAVLDELAATGQFPKNTLKKLRKLVAGRG